MRLALLERTLDAQNLEDASTSSNALSVFNGLAFVGVKHVARYSLVLASWGGSGLQKTTSSKTLHEFELERDNNRSVVSISYTKRNEKSAERLKRGYARLVSSRDGIPQKWRANVRSMLQKVTIRVAGKADEKIAADRYSIMVDPDDLRGADDNKILEFLIYQISNIWRVHFNADVRINRELTIDQHSILRIVTGSQSYNVSRLKSWSQSIAAKLYYEPNLIHDEQLQNRLSHYIILADQTFSHSPESSPVKSQMQAQLFSLQLELMKIAVDIKKTDPDTAAKIIEANERLRTLPTTTTRDFQEKPI